MTITVGSWRDNYYADLYDSRQRDPVSFNGRAAVPMSRGWAMYKRCNPSKETVWVTNPEGQMYELTRTQATIYGALTGSSGSYSGTVRALATLLTVSPSTISRAAVKLASFGLIVVLTGRGRYGGILTAKRVMNDGLDRFQKEARAKVRKWRETTRRRFVHKLLIVASLYDREIVAHGLASMYLNLMGATLSGVSWEQTRSERDDRIEAVLMGMQRRAKERVPCPAHEGQDRNLSFWRRPDGSLGTKCWSHQCTERQIKDAIEPWPVG